MFGASHRFRSVPGDLCTGPALSHSLNRDIQIEQREKAVELNEEN